MRDATRRALLKRAIIYPAVLAACVILLWIVSIRVPGESWAGPLLPLTVAEDTTSQRLAAHVRVLAGSSPHRDATHPAAYDSAAAYVETSFRRLGYAVSSQPHTARGRTYRNLEITIPGRRHKSQIVVVGAHYDAVLGSPGADDNASGTACLIELARLLRDRRPERTVRFVAFANEEPPWFFTEDMGSRRYAKAAKARGDRIVAMLSLETLGYYSDSAGSQRYPPVLGWFYPDRGDFVGFVGNIGSRSLVHEAVASFRAHTRFPSQASAAPMQFPGISWSDHWSFWKEGYDAIMITDTAPFRNPNYHTESDTPSTLDYPKMARVVHGVARTIEDLARAVPPSSFPF
jgi:Iap family predicted aminopeptidase